MRLMLKWWFFRNERKQLACAAAGTFRKCTQPSRTLSGWGL